MPRDSRRIRKALERAASESNPSLAINRVLRKLGPVGRVLQSIASIFGSGRRRPRSASNGEQEAAAFEAAMKQLERSGWTIGDNGEPIPPPAPPRPQPPVVRPPSSANRAPEGRPIEDDPEIDIRGRQRLDADPWSDDWSNVEWTLTPQSSNVYAFAYDATAQVLYVTYREYEPGRGKGDGPGLMYSYGGARTPFPERMYKALLRAQSKGKFIWDNLRVRGTVYGHRFPYTLVQAGPNGYVARRATRRGFRTRSVTQVRQVGDKRKRVTTRSRLPERIRARAGARTRY